MAHQDAWNGIIFTVPSAATVQIRRWQQEVNLRLIAGQLAKEGRIFVTRFGQDRGKRITELPALGEAEPNVGDFGGLYTFIFSPLPDRCDLQVVAAPAAFARAAIDPTPPLEIQIPGEVTLTTTAQIPYELDWSGPLLNRQEDINFVHEVTAEKLEFPIDGTMFRRLVRWGWDAWQIEAYRYLFTPLSVGCEILVEHQPSGQKVHLTEDVGW